MGRRAGTAACALLALGGLLARLPGLSDPPLDFHPTREYRSAILARGYVPELVAGPAVVRENAARAAASLPPIEPPIMERLAALIYRAAGREDPAWGRRLSAIAWSLGGLAMAWLAMELLSPLAAVVGVAVWTFLPFGIAASRAFQPDSLMSSLIVFTLAALLFHRRRSSRGSAVLFAAALGSALFVKAMAVFFLAGPVIAVVLLESRPRRWKAACAGIALAALAPAVYYYSRLDLATNYGPFVQLLLTRQFWIEWGAMIVRVVPWPVLLLAVMGAIYAPRPLGPVLAAAGAGYLLFGAIFTHHIHTHDYYSLPLIPFAALGVAAGVDAIGQRTRVRWAPQALAAIAVVAVTIVGVASVAEAQSSTRVAVIRAATARYADLGRIVDHSRRVIVLDGAYGLPLVYHGGVMASNWPLSGDRAVMPLTGEPDRSARDGIDGSGAEFFIATLQAELDAQPDLRQLLNREHPLIARDGAPDRWAYVVYDLRRGRLSVEPERLSLFGRVGDAAFEQTVSLFAPPAAPWTAQVDAGSALEIEPSTGRGPATLRVRMPPPAGELERVEHVTFTSTTESPLVLPIKIRALGGADQAPVGFVDAPPDPITLKDVPVVFQGWALDDISLARVWAAYVDAGQLVSIGDARREGRRPDIAAQYAAAPDLDRAAWALTLDPARLRQLRRPVELRFLAEDRKGNRTEIGARTVR